MLKPLRDYIVVKPFQRQDSNIIHVITNRRMVRGEVVAVGNGRYEKPEKDMHKRVLGVKVGDVINFGETPLKFPTYEENNTKFWILQEQDIAFIEEKQGIM